MSCKAGIMEPGQQDSMTVVRTALSSHRGRDEAMRRKNRNSSSAGGCRMSMSHAMRPPSAVVHAAVYGFAGLTSPTPTGIPAPPIRAPADSASPLAVSEALAIVQRHLLFALTPFCPSVSVKVDGERCVQSHHHTHDRLRHERPSGRHAEGRHSQD
jgi:hypothetical protein